MTPTPAKIRSARLAAGMTQAEAAERAGWKQPTWAAFEAGRYSPTLGTLERIAKTLGCAVKDLVD